MDCYDQNSRSEFDGVQNNILIWAKIGHLLTRRDAQTYDAELNPDRAWIGKLRALMSDVNAVGSPATVVSLVLL
jgi:hypothetical protein